jgi:hypothetical protein
MIRQPQKSAEEVDLAQGNSQAESKLWRWRDEIDRRWDWFVQGGNLPC